MRARFIAVVLAVTGAAGCGGSEAPPAPAPDPCALRTAGAPWLAFGTGEGGTWDVAVVRADGTCARVVAGDPAASDLHPAFGPGGVLAYDSDRAPFPSVWLHDLDTGAERRLDAGPLRAAAPAYSPDGTRLAFEGWYAGSTTSSVYVVPAAGGSPVELTPEVVPHGNGGPVFSPDGASIYFTSNRTGRWEVFRVPSALPTLDPEKVTTLSGIVGKPTVSPDGRTLAFTRNTATSTEVVLYDLATATITPLGVERASDPAFDPAGGRLALRVFRGMNAMIDLAPASGGGSSRLTWGRGPDGTPAFSRLGP